MHVIPSCEIPSFCTMDASSHTGNARLEPHIGNAGESVSDILTEKSSHVATHVTLVRTSHVSDGYVGFSRTFLGSPAGFGLAWRASYVRKRYLDDSRPGPYIALLRPPAHIRSFGPIHLLPIHACGAMFTPGARAIAGRVALMLLPACAVRAFCNLLIRTKMRART